MRRNRALALAILAILALAAVAPAGQASNAQSSERKAQRALIHAQQVAEHEAVRLQREANRAARNEAKAQQQAERQVKKEERAVRHQEAMKTPHADVTFSCTSIVVQFHDLTAPRSVYQKVIYRQAPAPLISYVFAPPTFVTTASGGTEEIPIVAPLGESIVSIRGHWKGDEPESRSFSVNEPMTCGPHSQFSLQTLQSVGGAFTSATLPGVLGEAVDYQTTATNTGNTPLLFGSIGQPGCDTPASGGIAGTVAPRGTVVWYCRHTLTAADQKAGAYATAASVVAAPQLDPFTSSIPQSSAPVVISPISGEVSTAAKPVAAGLPKAGLPKSSVLGFSSTAIPALLGPAKCVRGMFSASVKSAGVANVTFYIDGHKLVRRTAHSAVKGLIAVRINGAKLKAGVHRLLARISMSNTVNGSRTRTVRRCAAAHKH